MDWDVEGEGKMAWALALAGYLPFLALVVLLFALGPDHPLQSFLADALKIYAAIILSFLGGIRWGLAIARYGDPSAARDLALSVVPSLVGWFAVFLPHPWAFALLAVAYAGQGAWDAFSAGSEAGAGEWPQWFARLRSVLTVIVVAAMTAALFAVT